MAVLGTNGKLVLWRLPTLLGFHRLAKAIALAVHLKNVAAVSEPVQKRRDQRSRAVEGESDLVDDTSKAKQVPSSRGCETRIAEKITREDIFGRVHSWNPRS